VPAVHARLIADRRRRRGQRDNPAYDLIDLHCHILPSIDDGAADLSDSVAMARQSAADGIEVICATPHIRHDHDVRIDELADRVEELNRELTDRNVPVRIARGGEVAETALAGLDATELEQVALDGGRWVLLEPKPGPLSDSLEAAVDTLAGAGMGALIAHPERHLAEDLLARLAGLIERGALVQATAAYLAHPETAPGMATIAEHGLIHVLGSDAHSAAFGRTATLSEGLAALTELEPAASHHAWIEREAPDAILRGERVDPPFAPRP
jgi:protein-tyrosine phosphatase